MCYFAQPRRRLEYEIDEAAIGPVLKQHVGDCQPYIDQAMGVNILIVKSFCFRSCRLL